MWNEVINTNLTGLFNMTTRSGPACASASSAASSTSPRSTARRARPVRSTIPPTKAGDIGFTRALAQEGARAGITVNAICPGYIGTEMVRAIDETC
jgi:acetoacetyl-CoA reductase